MLFLIKVMKKVVPPAGKVAKEARECVQVN